MAFLFEDWPILYTRDPAATAYQAPEWLTAWARRLPSNATPLIALATSADNTPGAALALARHHTSGGHAVVEPLSAPHAEYVRPVGPEAENPLFAHALVHALLDHQGADVLLSDIPDSTVLGDVLSSRPGLHRTTMQCAAIRLPLRLDDLGLSPSVRRAHRRRRRDWTALTNAGRVAYTRTRTTEELLAALSSLIALHHLRWPGTGQPDPLDSAEDQWRTVLHHCGAGLATIAMLQLDHQPIAAQLLLHRGRTCYSLLTAWDPAHKNVAPGHALLRALGQDLADDQFLTLDLGRTLQHQVSYKADYAPIWTQSTTFATGVKSTDTGFPQGTTARS